MSKDDFREEKFEVVENIVKSDCVIIVTATKIETSTVHDKMKPLNGWNKLIRFHKGNWTYVLGVFGNYKAIHFECEMGSAGRNSSHTAVTETLALLNPKVVIMPGIAFGVNEEKQKIGDVIVAETIYPYDHARIGDKTIPRGTPVNATKLLINRFRAATTTWEFFIETDTRSELIIGPILSGEELVDNIDRRTDLVSQYPTVKGGEMEGSGLYVACEEKVNYILVKGIADFADGKKKVDKEAKQKIAIEAALSLCLEVFASETAFEELGLTSYTLLSAATVLLPVNATDILFELYDPSKESYYVSRELDKKIEGILVHFGIWVYGQSGFGKSNNILRNLYKNNDNFILISLASCVTEPILSYYQQIYIDLNEKIHPGQNPQTLTSAKQCIKKIISLLDANYRDKTLIIFIEEIPTSDYTIEQEFSEWFFALLIEKSKNLELKNVKFVLSSINDPQLHIRSHTQKIKELIQFVELKSWDPSDTQKLITLISKELRILLPLVVYQKLFEASKGSPRFVKTYFRKTLTAGNFEEDVLLEICSQTVNELNRI